MRLLVLALCDAVAERQPLPLRTPFPCNRLGATIWAECDARAFKLAAERPHLPINGNIVVAIEAMILK